jgi:hypothetical protein
LYNRRLFWEDEAYCLWEKTMAACPTYGVCYWCFGSGPTNMHCQMCKHRDRTYKILLSAKQRIIDAEWVSSFFGTTHMIAKADRTQNWLSPEQQVVAMDDIKIFMHERWHGRDGKAMFRIGTWELFHLGLTLRSHDQCMMSRVRGRQVEILIIKGHEIMFNG